MTTLQGSPTKLQDGSWGATVKGSAIAGQAVQITTKAGKSWPAQVSRVVWTDGSKTIVATESSKAPKAPKAAVRAPSRFTPYSSGAGSAVRMDGYSSYCTGRDGCGCYDCE